MKQSKVTPATPRRRAPSVAAAPAAPRTKNRRASAAAPARKAPVPAAPSPAPAAAPAIGARLRHARLVKGLLLKELAERVGV